MIFEFVLDELLVVENMPQVFFRVVVELGLVKSTIVKKSLKTMPSLLSPATCEKNLNKRLIFSFSVELDLSEFDEEVKDSQDKNNNQEVSENVNLNEEYLDDSDRTNEQENVDLGVDEPEEDPQI